jgi:hypothetical protein
MFENVTQPQKKSSVWKWVLAGLIVLGAFAYFASSASAQEPTDKPEGEQVTQAQAAPPCVPGQLKIVEPTGDWEKYNEDFPVDYRETNAILPCDGGTFQGVKMSKEAMKHRERMAKIAAKERAEAAKREFELEKRRIKASRPVDYCGGWNPPAGCIYQSFGGGAVIQSPILLSGGIVSRGGWSSGHQGSNTTFNTSVATSGVRSASVPSNNNWNQQVATSNGSTSRAPGNVNFQNQTGVGSTPTARPSTNVTHLTQVGVSNGVYAQPSSNTVHQTSVGINPQIPSRPGQNTVFCQVSCSQ